MIRVTMSLTEDTIRVLDILRSEMGEEEPPSRSAMVRKLVEDAYMDLNKKRERRGWHVLSLE